MVACLCHFVFSFFRLFAWRYGAAPRRNNAKPKDEITKKRQAKRRNNARRKDEKTKCATRNDEKRARKDEKTPREITPFKFLFFVFAHGVFSLFRLFAWRYFVISLYCVAFFVILSFRKALSSLFAPPERQAKRQKDEKTQREKTK